MSGALLAAAPASLRKGPNPSARANDNARPRGDRLVAPGGEYPFPDEVRARNTGRAYEAELWATGQQRRADLVRQSRWLADALEREGIRARETGDEAVDIDHVLGTVETVERFRSLRFLPVVMQRDSAEQLAALRYFMHNHEAATYARMAVITGGARVPAFGPLRERHRAMTRAVSKWAAEARVLYGVEVLFRGMEYTRQADGAGDLVATTSAATYHLHAHVIYSPTEYMEADGWTAFLGWSERFFRARLKGARYAFTDCGRIREPDEACKYPFKPAELATCPDREVAWLQTALHGLNLKQALGPFKTFRRDMADNRRVTGEEQVDQDTGEVSRVTVRAPLKVVSLYPAEEGGKATLAVVHKRRRPARGDRDATRDDDPDRPRGPVLRENVLLFTSNPTSSACPWATVKTRVVGYTETPTTQAGWEGLADLARITAEVRRAWDANKGPPPPSIPLRITAQAARLDREAAEAAAKDDGKGASDKGRRARLLRTLADRLRAAMRPGATSPQDPGAPQACPPYGVHTCSLSVPAFGGTQATGVPSEVAIPPPRSDYEAALARRAAEKLAPSAPAVPVVGETRPQHARPRLDEDALARAPLRVCRAVADYARWWAEERGRFS